MRLLAGLCLAVLCGQEPAPKPAEPSRPAVLEFQSAPLVVPFTCTEDDIQQFGLTCTEEEPCPVYLEIAAIEPLGNKVFAVGNLHTATMTLSSILLASEDGGKSWTEPFERLRATGLDQILFHDFETGWISGQSLQTLPRDPFFLVTNDGGKSWRQRPVFSDSRVGSVEHFWFESRTVGGMLIDRTQSGEAGARHELYETMTGGDSWMIRQVSPKPIPPKRTRTPNPDWRLRPHGPTQSYRIEKREGGTWKLVAAFRVEVGACTPKSRPLAEPPPEPSKPSADDVLVVPRSGQPAIKKAPPSLRKKRE